MDMIKTKITLFLFVFLYFLISQAATAENDEEELILKINRAYAADELLFSIHDLTIQGKVRIERPAGPMEMPVIFFAERPAKVKIVTQIMLHADQIQAFDGENAWIAEDGEVREMPEPAAHEIESLALTFIDGWLNHSEKGIEIHAPGERAIDGTEYLVLEAKDKYQNVSQFFYDRETLRLVRMRGHLVDAQGIVVPSELYFDDYKNFSGLNLACRVRAEENGKASWEQTITGVELNRGFPENFFAKPVPAKKDKEEKTKADSGVMGETEEGKKETEDAEKDDSRDEKNEGQNQAKEKPADEPETKP